MLRCDIGILRASAPFIDGRTCSVSGGPQRNGNVETADGQPLATYALQFFYQAIADSFRYPVAYFFTSSASAAMLAMWLQQGLTALADAGLDVLYILCDGGASNRALIHVRLLVDRYQAHRTY